MTAQLDKTPATVDHFRLGLLFAIASAFSFGLSGPLAKSLMEAGWSPTAAVTARLAGGALAMALFATVMKPDWVREALAHAKTVVAYGLVPIAGAQLCYYNAVSHLSVGVALLLEYTAPLLVVGWLWATTRHRPSNLTMAGVVLAVAGIMLYSVSFKAVDSPARTSTWQASAGAWPLPSARRATSSCPTKSPPTAAG